MDPEEDSVKFEFNNASMKNPKNTNTDMSIKSQKTLKSLKGFGNSLGITFGTSGGKGTKNPSQEYIEITDNNDVSLQK